MFERFTDRARTVLALAQEESRLLDHRFIGTEHILLGLVREGDGLAAKALGSLGISLEAARRQTEAMGLGGADPSAARPFTPRAKKVLELSLRAALQLGDNYIGTEHVLLGLVREGEGTGVKVLQSLGADPERVRRQVMSLLEGSATRGAHGPDTEAPVTARAVLVPRGRERAASFVVGRRVSAEVVVAGRRPEDFAAAYDQLAELARRLGLDGLDAERLDVGSVETDGGPGLRFSLVHELPSGGSSQDEAQPDAGASEP